MKPIEGMKTQPVGLPQMIEAWIDLLIYASHNKDLLIAFKSETGFDLIKILRASPINHMIDHNTGYDKTVLVAWADWITENFWGEE